MIKTIDELERDAKWYRRMVDASAESEEDHRQEMLRSAADKIKYQQQLDAVELALIVANGESS